MAEIPARSECGEIYPVILDDEDVDWAKQYKWHINRSGYVYRKTCIRLGAYKKSINAYMHRELMGLEYGQSLTVDHINTVRHDNRRANLEVVTASENQKRKHLRLGLEYEELACEAG